MKIIWIGLNKNGDVEYVWHKNCVQSFDKWRKAAKGLGCTEIIRCYLKICNTNTLL